MNPKIYFTADLHFGHKNVFKQNVKRIPEVYNYAVNNGYDGDYVMKIIQENGDETMELHDSWLVNMWNSQVKKRDRVFILGDFSQYNAEKTLEIIKRLNGSKTIIYGNHDSTAHKEVFETYFKSREDTMLIHYNKFNKKDGNGEDIAVFLSHYRHLVWPEKHYGSLHLCGHNHGRNDDFNEATNDLCVDVGIDGRLAKYKFVTLHEVYDYFKKKVKDLPFREYAEKKIEEGTMII